MKHIAITNIGSRSSNQDAYFAGENLYIVCDGVGGAAYSDVASKLACSSFAEYFKQNTAQVFDGNYMSKALQHTIQQFKETESKYPEMKGMATTVVLIAFDKDGAIIAWLGDSRLYHIRPDISGAEILFITEDHSLINDLRKQGHTDEQQLKNVRNYITKALSSKKYDGFSLHRIAESHIGGGDCFFLCTDGVLENITNEILRTELNTKNTLEQKAENVYAFCKGKTRDNFTFQIIEI
ncbi:MAG: serine/threonine-protein phosphatase [Chitinophagales bacterium]|nr:serine/threonine-protein phosphatase [Chitinophagales bacterium]